MEPYQLILLIPEPSMRRTPAFERARALAKTSGAALHIGVFVHSASIDLARLFNSAGASLAREAQLESHRHWLQVEAEALRSEGLTVTTDVAWTSHPAQQALELIARLRPGLVVKDADPEPMLAGRATVDENLLRRDQPPVLLVRGDAVAPRRRIAAVVEHASGEPAAFDNLVMSTAAELAAASGAELHLIHGGANGDYAVDTFAGSHGVAQAHCHGLPDAAAAAIAEFATRIGVDLLVVGVTEPPEARRPWHRGTAERINVYASCDVLSLKQHQSPVTRPQAAGGTRVSLPAAPPSVMSRGAPRGAGPGLRA
ncbi:MAG: hypothetical protein P4L83_07060 [Nevskia sp.]|nr:hypothetical protein [Nevskia sp.]